MLRQIGLVPTKPRDPLAAFRHNLSEELKARQTNMKGASAKADLGSTFVRDVIKRGRDPQLSYVAQLAKTHRLSLDRLLGLTQSNDNAVPAGGKVQVLGEVGAGVWHQVDAIDFEKEESPFPPDPRYPVDWQFDLVVRGTSINRFARDGERLRCVDVAKAGIDVFDDDLVIFERTRDDGQLIQTTAKRIRKRGPVIELWPDSDDEKWQEPERLDPRREEAQGRIVGVVLYSYNPARSRPRR